MSCKNCYSVGKDCQDCLDKSFARKLKQRYGLTLADYNRMFTEQGGVCAICSQPEIHSYRRRLSVDHDHETGEVRGLLCHACNTGLGKFFENAELLEVAAAYLRRGV